MANSKSTNNALLRSASQKIEEQKAKNELNRYRTYGTDNAYDQLSEMMARNRMKAAETPAASSVSSGINMDSITSQMADNQLRKAARNEKVNYGINLSENTGADQASSFFRNNMKNKTYGTRREESYIAPETADADTAFSYLNGMLDNVISKVKGNRNASSSQAKNQEMAEQLARKINKNNGKDLGQYGKGNIDLYNRPQYKYPNGSTATVESMSFGTDEGEILVPTIAFDKNGNAVKLSEDEAIKRYYDTGEYLGKFKTPEEADEYANKLHEQQGKYYLGKNKEIDISNVNNLPKTSLNSAKYLNEGGKGKNSYTEIKNQYAVDPQFQRRLDASKNVENAINMQNAVDNARDFAEEHPFAGVGMNLASDAVGSVITPIAAAQQKIKGTKEYDQNSNAFKYTNISDAYREGIKKAAGADDGTTEGFVKSFLIDTGLSMVQSTVRAATLTPLAGAVQAGLGAGSSAFVEAKKNGASDSQALMQGAAQGIAEELFEKLSLENLDAFSGKPVDTIKTAVMNVLKQAVTEGSEEAFTEIANAVTDALIMGNQSQWQQWREEAIRGGASEKGANVYAISKLKDQVLLSALGGAISGAGMGGSVEALQSGMQLNAARGSQLGATGDNSYGKVASNVVTDPMAYRDASGNVYTDVSQLATDIKDRADSYAKRSIGGKPVNNLEKGYLQMQIDSLNKATANLKNDKLNPIKLNLLPVSTNENEEGFTVKDSNDQWEQVLSRPDFSEAEITDGTTTYNVVRDGDTIKVEKNQLGSDPVVQEFNINDIGNGGDTDIVSFMPMQSADQNAPKLDANVRFDARNATDEAVETYRTKVAEKAAKNNQSQFADYTKENSVRLNTARSMNTMVNMYNGRVDKQRYLNAYKQAYVAGYNGMSVDRLQNMPTVNAFLTNEQKMQAFRDGMTDSNLKAQIKPVYVNGEARKGGVTVGSEKLSNTQNKVLNWVGNKTGLRIEVVEGLKGNAEINVDAGVMRINPYTRNFLGSVSHELTHLIRQFSPEEYNTLQKLTVEALMNSKNADYNTIFRQYETAYKAEHADYTVNDVLEEMTADGATAFLNDPVFAEKLAREDKGLATKIADFYKGIADSLKQLIDEKGIRNVGKVLRENEKLYRKAADTWYAALEKASERYIAGERIEGTRSITKEELNNLFAEELNKKKEKEYKRDNKYTICNTPFELKNFLNRIIQSKNKSFTGILGMPTLKGALRFLNETNIDILNKVFSIQLSGYNHTMNRHGVGNEEISDQIEVTNNDIVNFPLIVSDYNFIIPGANGKEFSFYNFYKYIDGNTNVVRVRMDKKNLALDTMLKIKGEISKEEAEKRSKKIGAVSSPTNQQNAAPTNAQSAVMANSNNGTITPDNGNSNNNLTGDKEQLEFDGAVEQTKDLIAVRNVDTSNIMSMMQLEGLPSPSIAITKDKIGHVAFGDITFIFGKNTIDPQYDKRNLVFDADAWTPVYPGIDYEYDKKVLGRAYKEIQNIIEKSNIPEDFKRDASGFVNNIEYGNYSIDQIVERANNDNSLKQVFLATQGKEVQWIQEEATNELTDNEVKMSEYIIKEYDKLDLEGMSRFDVLDAKIDAVREGVRNYLLDMGKISEQEVNDVVDIMTRRDLAGYKKTADEYRRNGKVKTETKRDYQATNKAINDAIENIEYEKWVRDLFDGVIAQTGISKGVDPFTASGNRKSFKQTHDPVTAENIVKAMYREGKEQGAVKFAGYSAKSVRGAAARKYNSIDDLHKNSGRLQNISEGTLFSENETALLEESNNRLHALMSEILKNAGYEFGKSSVDSFVGAENLYTEAIINAASKQTGKEGIKKEFKKNGFDLTKEELNEMNDIFNELRNLPTDYFEAKPKRVVGWNEIKLALVPDNTDPEIVQKLKDVGVSRIETYPAGDNETRLEMENQAEDLKFQLDIDDNIETDYADNMVLDSSRELRESTETLGQLLSATHYMPSDEMIIATAKKLKKDTGTDTDIEKITEDLKSFYNFIAYNSKIDGRDMSKIAADYVGDLLSNSTKVTYDQKEVERYRGIKNVLKKYTFHMPEGYKGELDALGGVAGLRREFFGTLNITKEKGLALDEIYSELADALPEYLDRNNMNPANQLEDIVTVLRLNKPKASIGWSNQNDFDAARYFIGQDIFRAYSLQGIADIGGRAVYNELNTKENDILQAKATEMQARYMDELQKAKQMVSKQTMRDRVYEARKSSKSRYHKDQIMKDARELSNWLLKPTDKKHVPEVLRQPLANFLSQLDFTSSNLGLDGEPTQRSLYWMQLKDTWMKIANNGGMAQGDDGSQQYMIIDTDVLSKMSELTDKIKDIKKLEDLEYLDLVKLNDIMKSMKHSIQTANEMISLNRSVTDVADGTLNYLSDLNTKKKYSGAVGTFRDMMQNKMLDATTRFHTFGKDANDVYQAVRKGFNKKVQHTAQAATMFDQIKNRVGVDDREINRWSKSESMLHYTTERGEKLDITVAQLMNLYNLLKREQSRDHIHDGGIVLTTTKMTDNWKDRLTGRISDQEKMLLTMKDTAMLVNMLTDQQKRFADELMYTMQEFAKWGNETSMELMGYKKFMDPHYWPIKSSRDYLSMDLDQAAAGGVVGVAVKNAGPTKSLVKHANNPITVGDVIDVWSDHVNFMANYNAFTIPLTDLVKWYNYIERGQRDEETGEIVGDRYKTSIKQEIKRTFGDDADGFILRFIEDVNGMGNKDRSVVNGLISAFKGSAVGANLSVAIQQPTAVFRAMAVMDPKYLTSSVVAKSEADWNTIKRYSSMAQWKDWGFFEINTGKSMKSILTGQDTLLENLNEKQMWLAGKGDEITWKKLWTAAELQVKDQNRDLKPGTDAFYKKTAEVFDNVIDQTQVVDSVFTKSDLMRSKSEMNKMLTSFFAEPTKSYNMLYRAAFDYTIADSEKKKAAAKNLLVRSTSAFLLSNVAAAMAKSIISAMRDKDDDRDTEFWERWWSHAVDEFMGNVNPINYIPYVKDAYSVLFGGYSVTRADMQAVQDLKYVSDRWKKYFSGESNYSLGNNILYTTKALSTFTGLAAYGLQRDLNAVIDTAIELGGAQGLNYEKQKLTGKDIGSKSNITYYLRKAMKAYESGNTALGDKIVRDMMNAGIPEEKIESKKKDFLKEDAAMQELINAVMANDQDSIGRIREELIRSGYSDDMISGQITSGLGTSMKENNLTYAGMNSELDRITDYSTKGYADFYNLYNEWRDASKIKNGWTEKECAQNFRSQCTKYFKPLYKNGNAQERSRILNILSRLVINGERVYKESDIKKWSE